MPTIPGSAQGGVDALGRISQLFEQQTLQQQEQFQVNMNLMTSMQQRLLGSMDFQNPTYNTSVAGQVRSSVAQQLSPAAPTQPPPAVGDTMAGITTAQTLRQQQQQAMEQQTWQSPRPTGSYQGQMSAPGQAPMPQNYYQNPVNWPSQQPYTVPGAPGASPGPSGGGPRGSQGSGGSGSGGGGNGGGGNGGLGGFGVPPVPVNPQGGFVSQMLPSLVSHVPVVGSTLSKALSLGGGALDEWRNQKNKNLWYVANAGDTETEAIGDRAQEEMAHFRHPTTFSSAEIEQAFKQATAMGYTQNAQGMAFSRNDIINQMSDMKNQLGMSVGQSAALENQMNITGDATGITQLIDQLKQLDEAASKSGTSVSIFRQNVISTQQNMANLWGGVAGQNIATGQASVTANLGEGGQAVMGNLYSQMFSNTGYDYMAASQAGMSMAAMSSEIIGNSNAAASTMMGATAGDIKGFLQSNLGPQGYQDLLAMVNQNQGGLGGQNSFQTARNIANTFLTTHRINPQLLVQGAKMFANYTGSSPVDALAQIITEYLGPSSTLAKSTQQAKQSATVNSQGQVVGGKNAGQQVTGAGTAALQALVKQEGTNSGAAQALLGVDQQSGQYSQSVKNIISKMGGGDPLISLMIDGKQRVMHMSEAIRSGLSASIAGGAAQFATGPNAGKSIAQNYGLADESNATQAAQRQEREHGPAVGKLFSQMSKQFQQEYYAQQKKNSSDVTKALQKGQKVIVELKGAAKDLFKVTSGFFEDAMGTPRSDTNSIVRDYKGSGKDSSHIGAMLASPTIEGLR